MPAFFSMYVFRISERFVVVVVTTTIPNEAASHLFILCGEPIALAQASPNKSTPTSYKSLT